MHDPRHDAQRLAEQLNENVYAPSTGINVSTGYARLRIDMTLMTDDERQKVYDAENLLQSVGVIFDSNSGGGFRNWELDWSLSGATVETKPLMCSSLMCDNPALPCWASFRLPSGRTMNYAYCSTSCREQDIERVGVEMGWECLIRH